LIDVRNNVAGLSEAGYNRLPNRNTPDFVVMFVPNEPALFTALQSDSRLWQDAYKQNILLVGPTTLLSIIRIVNMLWVEERQEQNVEAVMDRGAKMLDKFNNFIDDMQKIDNSLKKARECYDAAYGKLESGPGNLISQAVKLQQLGVRPKKSTLARFGETGVIMADTIEDADIEMADFVLEDKAENDSHSSAN
jgi:DNA recombination protein RmuC